MDNNNNRPKVGIGVYVFNPEGKILIGKRKNAHGEEAYAPPGGHLEFGESFEECAAREVLEETGITIKNIKFAGVINHVSSEENYHCVVVAMTAIWNGGDIKLMEPDKCEGWEWHDWKNFPKNIAPCAKELQKQIKTLKP